jgi:hypothetical protein
MIGSLIIILIIGLIDVIIIHMRVPSFTIRSTHLVLLKASFINIITFEWSLDILSINHSCVFLVLHIVIYNKDILLSRTVDHNSI